MIFSDKNPKEKKKTESKSLRRKKVKGKELLYKNLSHFVNLHVMERNQGLSVVRNEVNATRRMRLLYVECKWIGTDITIKIY